MKTSVAICTYNGENFIREQLDSILSQTISVDEIVICDDGSADATWSILQEYQQKYPSLFHIYQNETNLRSVKNFEKAISLCSHSWIFLSDQDDVWLENKVEFILNYIRQKPTLKAVATNGFAIDESSNALDVYTIWDAVSEHAPNEADRNYFKMITQVGNFCTGASMLVNRHFVQGIMPFPEIEGYHHDEWIAVNAARQQALGFIDEKLFFYRQHSNQQVGGVFFEKSPKVSSFLRKHFNASREVFSLNGHKRSLKRLSNVIKLYQSFHLQSNNTNFKEIENDLIENFQDIKHSMILRFPIRSRFQLLADKYTGKRQLPKN